VAELRVEENENKERDRKERQEIMFMVSLFQKEETG
jgi:hypothetical protein